MEILDLIVVEYSVSQKAFHSQKVSEMIEGNLRNSIVKISTDYIPIGFFETEDKATEYIYGIRTEIERH